MLRLDVYSTDCWGQIKTQTCSFLNGVQFLQFPSPLSKTGAIPQTPHIAESQFLAVIASNAKYPSYSFCSRYSNSSFLIFKSCLLAVRELLCKTAWAQFPGGSPRLMWHLISKRMSNETNNLLDMLNTPTKNLQIENKNHSSFTIISVPTIPPCAVLVPGITLGI